MGCRSQRDLVVSGIHLPSWSRPFAQLTTDTGCSSIETNVGIICACALTLRPFVRKFFPKLFDSTGRSNSREKPYSPAQLSWKAWPRSKPTNASTVMSQRGDQKDGEYLELGENGATETIISTSKPDDTGLPVMGLDHDGKIVKTMGVDISKGSQGEALQPRS